MAKFYWTQEKEDWQLWDEFLQENPRGIYLQTRSWLESYKSYGFSNELLLAKNSSGELIGGLGVVLAGVGPLKILIAPYGPILSDGNENIANEIIGEFNLKAKKLGAFLSQLSFPAEVFSESMHPKHLLDSSIIETIFPDTKKGVIFKYVTGLSGFRAVNLFPGDPNAYEKVRANYSSSAKRRINKGGKVGNELHIPKSEEEINEAYKLIQLNSDNQGYAVRGWEDFGPTLINMVAQGQCFFACCKNAGSLKGVLIIFDVGHKLHYIMGGTLREEIDLKVGHFLQDQVIQIGIEKGYDFYDISMGGSEGVVHFKEGFGGEIAELTETRYWVLKPLQFAVFQKLMPWVQKNKSKVAKILSKLN